MSVPLSYLGIVLVWSTTPLAVKWSTEGSSFIFAISSRIWLATVLSLGLMFFLKKRILWHRRALQGYLASATGLYGAMMCIYWSSQYITSGIMSVIFGTSPLITGIIAALWLGEKSLGIFKLIGMALGFTGLYIIFAEGSSIGDMVYYGILIQFLGVLIHSFTLVWIKSLKLEIPAISMTSGSMLLACIPYTLTWAFMGGSVPAHVDTVTISAIVYLAMVGSVIAFVMMFYVIKHVDASTMALIPLITPVLSLSFGRLLNHEYISVQVITGAALIIGGLLFHNWNLVFRMFHLVGAGVKTRLQPLLALCAGLGRKT